MLLLITATSKAKYIITTTHNIKVKKTQQHGIVNEHGFIDFLLVNKT